MKDTVSVVDVHYVYRQLNAKCMTTSIFTAYTHKRPSKVMGNTIFCPLKCPRKLLQYAFHDKVAKYEPMT